MPSKSGRLPKLNNQSMTSAEDSPASIEDTRRRQLVEVTIDSLAELGYVGTTLAQIAARAGVSPGLVAHYFGDKDGLLDAAFRSLARRVGDQVRARLAPSEHAARAHSSHHRCESGSGGIRATHRDRVARVLGSGIAGPGVEACAISLSAAHFVEPAQLSEEIGAAGRGSALGCHDRRDDRRRVAARCALRLAGGRQ